MKQYSSSLAETPRQFQGLGQLRYRWVRQLVKNKTVLELGSGLGEGAAFLAQAGAKKVTGIDYARQAVTEARRRFKGKNLEFRLMNVMEMDRLKRKYDVVIGFELLEHVDKQEQVRLVGLIKGILRPGGLVVMSTPNRLVFSKGKNKSRYPFHKHELTVEEMRKLFKKEFKRVRVKGIECVNKEHLKQRQKLEASRWHQMINWWAGFGWVHRLLPMIPRSLKGWVTGEGGLSELGVDDYRLVSKGAEECEDLWLEARV